MKSQKAMTMFIFKDMVYLDAVRVELHYEMPLNEIIYDFFDALKSRTRGYGSLDYELIGYRPSRLVKLDILLNPRDHFPSKHRLYQGTGEDPGGTG